jgi:hypothetical protein
MYIIPHGIISRGRLYTLYLGNNITCKIIRSPGGYKISIVSFFKKANLQVGPEIPAATNAL